MSFTPMKKKKSPKAGCRVMPNAVVLKKGKRDLLFSLLIDVFTWSRLFFLLFCVFSLQGYLVFP